MSFLWDATDDGSGSAARSSRWRPDRIPDRARNLAIATAAGAIIAYLAAQMLFGTGSRSTWAETPVEEVPAATSIGTEHVSAPFASPSPTELEGQASSDKYREHAFGLHELRGLPPDVEPGTPLEIWVAWEEAIAEGPGVQRLLMDASLVRFIEPVTPDGPVVVVLRVPLRWMEDLLIGQRYGSLSVAIPRA